MDDSSKKDFLVIRKLLDAAQLKPTPARKGSGVMEPFDYDFRRQDCGSQTAAHHELSLFQCEYTMRDKKSVSSNSTQTDDTPDTTSVIDLDSRDSLNLMRDLELNLADSEARHLRTKEYQYFWRSLASSCLFSTVVTVAFPDRSTLSIYKLIISRDEWFLFDDKFVDDDPVLCIASKFITVSLELDDLIITVSEMAITKMILHFHEKRDMLKLLLSALSYSNIPVSLIDNREKADPTSVSPRE